MCAVMVANLGGDVAVAQRRGGAARSRAVRKAAPARPSPVIKAEARFVTLKNDYLRGDADFHPTAWMTFDAGKTGGMRGLETRSAATIADEVRRLQSALSNINALRRTAGNNLSGESRDTLAEIEAHARRELFALEDAHVWRRDPTLYTSLIGRHVDALFGDAGLDARQRYDLFLRFSDDLERLLDESRANLTSVSPPAAEAGAEDARGCVTYFRQVVPQLFERAEGVRLLPAAARAGFADANNAVVARLEAYRAWLERELIPRSTAVPPALNIKNYNRKLTLELGRETDARVVRREAEMELRQVQSEIRNLAEQIAPGRGMAAAIAVVRRERPAAAGLVGEARVEFDRLAAFLQTQNLFDAARVLSNFTVAETPSYARALETATLEGNRFYITPPPDTDSNSNFDAASEREYLSTLNRYTLPFLLMKHHVAPRYTGLAADASGTRLPSSFVSEFFNRAWGEYAARVLIERGFGGGNPKFRFAALHLRQLALSRLIADVRVNTEGMSEAEAVNFIGREAGVPSSVARREVRWMWLHPTLAVADTTGANLIGRLFVTSTENDDFESIARRLMLNAILPLEMAVKRAANPLSATGSDAANLSRVSPAAQANEADLMKVDFTVIATGTMSNYEGGRVIEFVSNEQAWRQTWLQTLGANVNASVPDINFATRSVIVVRQGARPSAGYSISVRAVTRDERGLRVAVDEQTPARDGFTAQVITSPFVVIAVPRVSGVEAVRFDTPETKPNRINTAPERVSPTPSSSRPPVHRRTSPRRRASRP